MRAGERFAAELGLGDVPAARLSQTMERHLGGATERKPSRSASDENAGGVPTPRA